MTVTVNIHEAKTHLSRLIEQVLAGEQVVIAKAGKPIVDLVVHTSLKIEVGSLHGQLEYHDEDFDEVDEQISEMFYGVDTSS